MTSGVGVLIDTSNLTTGTALLVISDSADTGNRNIVNLQNSNVLASGANVLKYLSSCRCTGYSFVLGNSTTDNAFRLAADNLTTGSAAFIRSTSSDASVRNLVHIQNFDGASSGTRALFIDQMPMGLRYKSIVENTNTAA